MKHDGKKEGYVSPAAMTGFVAIALAFILFPFHPGLAVIPLSVFVFLCVMAPFFPSRGFFLPVISRGHTGRPVVSLTFDDGPDPVTTPPLLQLLERYAARATFFVTGEKAAQYGNLISEILADGHDIGNHSYSHDPFLMLRRSEKVYREIEATQVLLRRFGISPVAFRPPVGITSPKLANALEQQGLRCVTFSCRAFDGGNRFLRDLSGRILKKVKPDDIILLHDIRPKGTVDAEVFLREMEAILSSLKNRGLQVVPLAELLGKPVMIRINGDD
ncbi:MAG: polysaccharide deacetylase family protein [Desulfobacterales bacterium]|nr:polysaccharide deacetylase family protein [Desulfobacterales bacterium]